MKLLLVGSGARENALAWKLSQSNVVDELKSWPGSLAMDRLCPRLTAEKLDFDEVLQLVKKQGFDGIVVGPEQPLAEGFADLAHTHLPW